MILQKKDSQMDSFRDQNIIQQIVEPSENIKEKDVDEDSFDSDIEMYNGKEVKNQSKRTYTTPFPLVRQTSKLKKRSSLKIEQFINFYSNLSNRQIKKIEVKPTTSRTGSTKSLLQFWESNQNSKK